MRRRMRESAPSTRRQPYPLPRRPARDFRYNSRDHDHGHGTIHPKHPDHAGCKHFTPAVETALNARHTDPPALLRRLEDASLGEEASALGRARAVRADDWRGFAFAVEDFNLVAPFADGMEIATCGEAQPLPLSREWVVGILPLRGAIYTVIDFARFIGCGAVAAAGAHASPRANLLLVSNERIQSALLLDNPIRLRTFRHDLPGAEAAGFPPALAPFLARVVDDGRPWGVLDVAALTSSERFVTIGVDNPR